jgi:hypothetical protein
MELTTLEPRRKRGDLIQFFKLINQSDSINLSNKHVSRDSLCVTGPAAATRGNNKRVRLQSFDSREINDFYSSVSARMHFLQIERVNGGTSCRVI